MTASVPDIGRLATPGEGDLEVRDGTVLRRGRSRW